MEQTPVHEFHNPELLRLIPLTSKKVIEIGCSSGALAREFKKNQQDVNWVGVEIDDAYAALANRYCDKTIVANIDDCDNGFFQAFADRDCWVFGDTLEHFKDPWAVLKKIRNVIPSHGCVVACIPNAQHWSVVMRLATGAFRYEDSGLLDRTHLRWFTRQTVYELFETQGFRVTGGLTRILDEPNRAKFLPHIAEIAKTVGVDPDLAINDATPIQFVIHATPI